MSEPREEARHRAATYLRQNAGAYPPEALRAALHAQGYDEATIDAAMAEARGEVPAPEAHRRAWPWGLLLGLGEMVVSGLGSAALTTSKLGEQLLPLFTISISFGLLVQLVAGLIWSRKRSGRILLFATLTIVTAVVLSLGVLLAICFGSLRGHR